MLITLLFSLIS